MINKKQIRLVLFSFIPTITYIFITFRMHFHSDAATKNILAQEIKRTGQLFPSDWLFGNADIWLLYNHLFIVPLLYFFENSFYLHAVSNLIFALLLLFSLLYFLHAAKLRTAPGFLLIPLTFSGISPFMAENLFGVVSYGYAWGLLILLLTFGHYFHYYSASKLRPGSFAQWAGLMVMAGIYFACGITGIRGLFSFLIPLIGTQILCEAIKYIKGRATPQYINTTFMGILILSWLCGYCINQFLLNDLHFLNISATVVFVDFETILSNFKMFVQGYLFSSGLFFIDPSTSATTFSSLYGLMIKSSAGAEALYRFILFSVIFVAPWVMLVRLEKIERYELRFLIVFHSLTFCLIFFLYIFGSGLALGIGSARYFFIPQFLSILIAIFYLDKMRKKFGKRIIHITLIALIPLFVFNWKFMIYEGFEYRGNQLQLIASRHDATAKFLVTENLTHGYASFWNAEVISVLSAGKTKIHAVEVNGNGINPFFTLTSKDFYRAERYKGPTFLMLTDDEYRLAQKQITVFLGKPIRELHFSQYRIMEYQYNIMQSTIKSKG